MGKISMDIEVIPVNKVKVKFKGKSLGEFDRKSSWEGMIKLQNKDGAIIIVDDINIIDKLFDGVMSDKEHKTYSVLKIKPVINSIRG